MTVLFIAIIFSRQASDLDIIGLLVTNSKGKQRKHGTHTALTYNWGFLEKWKEEEEHEQKTWEAGKVVQEKLSTWRNTTLPIGITEPRIWPAHGCPIRHYLFLRYHACRAKMLEWLLPRNTKRHQGPLLLVIFPYTYEIVAVGPYFRPRLFCLGYKIKNARRLKEAHVIKWSVCPPHVSGTSIVPNVWFVRNIYSQRAIRMRQRLQRKRRKR